LSIISLEDYIDFYKEKNQLYGGSFSNRKNSFNDIQLERKYNQYLRREENNKKKGEEQYNKIEVYKEDLLWKELKESLDLRECRLVSILKKGNFNSILSDLKENSKHLFYIIDPAHIFPKGVYPFLKYDKRNIIPLNRYSHSCLDTMRDPIYGNNISKEEHTEYWKRLVGEQLYNELLQEIRGRNGKKSIR
jgi:hypothetical protein